MVYCVVPFCKSNSLKHTVSFHEVPVDPIRRIKWTIAISRQGPEKGSLWNPKERDAVCEKHFLPSDYKVGCKIKILKKDAIPSVFPLYPKYMSPEVSAVRRELFKHTLSKRRETSEQSPQLPVKIEISEESPQPSVSNSPMQSETTVEFLQPSVSNSPMQSETTVESLQPSVSNRPVQSETTVEFLQPSVSNRPVQSETTVESLQPSVSNFPTQSKTTVESLQPSVSNRLVKSEVPQQSYPTYEQLYTINRSNVDRKYTLLRKKFRRMTVTISKNKKKLRILRMKKKELTIENKKLKKVLNERHMLNDIELDAHLCHTDAAFLLDQINARRYKKPRWSDITLKQCFLWYRYSPSGYRYIKSTSMMKLPSVSTIKRYMECNSTEKKIVTEKAK